MKSLGFLSLGACCQYLVSGMWELSQSYMYGDGHGLQPVAAGVLCTVLIFCMVALAILADKPDAEDTDHD